MQRLRFTYFIRGRLSLLGVIGLLAVTPASGQLLLNEMMPSNTLTFADQFGDFPDWIEVMNASDSSVPMDQFYLSDDPDSLLKWNFPEMDLQAGGYALVFASGNNIREGVIHWHTLINMGDWWNYHVPTSDIGASWKTTFQTGENWQLGKSGLGYGDWDDSTVVDTTISLYLQKEFELIDTSGIKYIALHMDYDDGFIAYLNGVECARSSTMGAPGTPFGYNDPSNSGHEATMYKAEPIEEFSIDRSLLKAGTNLLSIEVHNAGPNSSDMTAIPILVMGATGIFPDFGLGNSYVSLSDRYPHASFKIKSNGEPLYISSFDGRVVDSFAMIAVPNDYSYGRPSGETVDGFGFFETPTPGAPNPSTYAQAFLLDSVEILNLDKPYDTVQQLILTSSNSTDSIYYTLDGSEPGRSDTLYHGAISVDKTTVLRARILKTNCLPGPITTKTVFTGRRHHLKILSITMEPVDLWDWETGIYVMGPNASPEIPYNGANFRQDWERPVHFEIIDTTGALLFGQSGGTKIFGGRSRMNAQKSQTFYARSSYGKGVFDYPLFSTKKLSRFEAFVARNSGNDWCRSMFRDGLSAYLAAEMKLDHQAYEPVTQYLNGEYWGLINLREKIHEHYVAANHHVDPTEVNLLRAKNDVQIGSRERYDQLLEYLRNSDLSDDAVFEGVQHYMDTEYYIRYWALNVYINNRDWPGNNVKVWSTNTPGAQWRWILYDTDFSYGPWGDSDFKKNTLLFALGEGNVHNYANADYATEVIRMLIKNEQFRNKLCNAFADGMNYTFHQDRMLPVIDSFQNRIHSEIPYHYARWERSVDEWYMQVGRINTYFSRRAEFMNQHLMDRFSIAERHEIHIESNDPEAGSVRINTIIPETLPFRGSYYHNIPIELQALPNPGYRFSHWEGSLEADSSIISYGMTDTASFKAIFVVSEEAPSIVINEINYHSSMDRDTKDWVELYNHCNTPVDLAGWYLEDGFNGTRFYFQDETILAPGDYLVVNESRPDFKGFFPQEGPIAGDMAIKLGSFRDEVALFTPESELHDHVTYDGSYPWPALANGTGATLELIHPDLDNTLPENWKASLDGVGTPCAINSQFAEPVLSADPASISLARLNVYPSPFKGFTHIELRLIQEMEVFLGVYDLSGRQIHQISNGKLGHGDHQFNWRPGSRTPGGLYIIRLETPEQVRNLRVVYL